MAALPVQQVVDTLHAAGLSLALTPDLALKVTPASSLTPELRDLIRSRKDDLVGWLRHEAANDPQSAPATDPDRRAWPHSSAMNVQELDTLMARQDLFCQRGASAQDAERMADRLVNRDRDDDDRLLCLECRHLRGEDPYRCGNAQAAGVHADLSRDLVLTLQRCHGYEDARLPMVVIVDAAPPKPAPKPTQAPAPTSSSPKWWELARAGLSGAPPAMHRVPVRRQGLRAALLDWCCTLAGYDLGVTP